MKAQGISIFLTHNLEVLGSSPRWPTKRITKVIRFFLLWGLSPTVISFVGLFAPAAPTANNFTDIRLSEFLILQGGFSLNGNSHLKHITYIVDAER